MGFLSSVDIYVRIEAPMERGLMQHLGQLGNERVVSQNRGPDEEGIWIASD